MDKNKSYVGVVEASQLLGLSIRTIQRHVALGRIAGTKLGEGVRAPYLLDRQQVLALAEKRANK